MTKPTLAIITDNASSWSIENTRSLVERLRAEGFSSELYHRTADARSADIAVYLSCERIVPASERSRFGHNVVVHASALPKGRGWSPMTWQVLEGASSITVTLFEAQDELDAGPIYLQREITLEGHELVDELRALLNGATDELVMELCRAWPNFAAREQTGVPSFYSRRRPADSRLDPDKPLREQFDLLRVVDNDRYPAFFELRGHIYELRISKRERE